MVGDVGVPAEDQLFQGGRGSHPHELTDLLHLIVRELHIGEVSLLDALAPDQLQGGSQNVRFFVGQLQSESLPDVLLDKTADDLVLDRDIIFELSLERTRVVLFLAQDDLLNENVVLNRRQKALSDNAIAQLVPLKVEDLYVRVIL